MGGQRGPRLRSALTGGPAERERSPDPAQPGTDHRRRSDRLLLESPRQPQVAPPGRARPDRPDRLGDDLRHDALGGSAGHGRRHEHPHRRSHLRHARLGIPMGPHPTPARVQRTRRPAVDVTDHHPRRGLRSLDRLRGLPPRSHEGGARHRCHTRSGRGARPRPHWRDRQRRRRVSGAGDGRARPVPARVRQGTGPGRRLRRTPRCDGRPSRLGPRNDEAPRGRRLVVSLDASLERRSASRDVVPEVPLVPELVFSGDVPAAT